MTSQAVWRFVLGLIFRFGKNLTCPRCRTDQALPKALPREHIDAAIQCSNCGEHSSLLEYFGATSPKGRGGGRSSASHQKKSAPIASIKPESSKIIRYDDGARVLWKIPRGHGSNFLFIFAVIWNVLSWVYFAQALANGDAEILAKLIVALFPLVGVILLFFALRAKFSTYLLGVTAENVMLERRLLGWTKRYRLKTRDVFSIHVKEFYQQNYQPVYGVEIRSAGGKIRFGTSLSDAEKEWLCQQLRVEISRFSDGEQFAGDLYSSTSAGAGKRHLIIEELPERLLIKTPRARWLPILAIIGAIVLIGSAFFLGDAVVGNVGDLMEAVREGNVVLVGFIAIFFLVQSLMVIVSFGIGLVLLALGIFGGSAASTVSVSTSGAEWRRGSGIRAGDHRYLKREGVRAVRVSSTTRRGEIIGSEYVIPFGFNCREEDIHRAAAHIRRLLGHAASKSAANN